MKPTQSLHVSHQIRGLRELRKKLKREFLKNLFDKKQIFTQMMKNYEGSI